MNPLCGILCQAYYKLVKEIKGLLQNIPTIFILLRGTTPPSLLTPYENCVVISKIIVYVPFVSRHALDNHGFCPHRANSVSGM